RSSVWRCEGVTPMLFRIFAIAFLALAAAEPSSQPADQVVIDNFRFEPQVLTVSPGTTVTWINRDDVPHTATATGKPREFASKALDTDEKFSHTFKTAGIYPYFCAVHPHMTGKVIVK